MKNVFQLRSSYVVAMLLALILPILAACGGDQPATTDPGTDGSPATTDTGSTGDPNTPEGNVLRISYAVFPDALNPQTSSFSQEIATLALNYEGLTGLDKDLQTVPAAAESWEYNEDSTEITFKLRAGLSYSDGSPLTAQDFVNAVRRTLSPIAPGDYQTIISMIQGANEIISTQIPTDTETLPDRFEALQAIAVDDTTLTFKLTQPTPFFHTLASMWMFFPAKQDLVEAGGETWWETASNQIGNGPFQFTNIDIQNQVIEYVANENYWQGRPQLDGVTIRVIEDLTVAFQAYQNNEIDMFEPDPNDVPTIKADPQLSQELLEYPGSCTLAIGFNLTKPPFDNLKVRQAFSTALDREGITRDAYKETYVPTLTWIPPGFPGYDEGETRFAFNPDQAKQLLADAGFPNGEGLPEVKFSYNSNNPANQARAEYIIQSLQASLGVTVLPDPVEGTTLTGLRKSVETHPAMLIGGWCADYPDPQNWLSVYWKSSENFAKNIGYANADADQLMNEADITQDEATRMDLYQQAQNLIIEDIGHAMLMNNLNVYMVKPHVKGLDLTPQDSTFPGQETALINATIER
ncbi:MAG: peptide ABC transporter substrate-binding protein [Chloroflexales bacterium]|nr:peptide ABC transporter substrate-binding protein [Chloroflexales bacterium]